VSPSPYMTKNRLNDLIAAIPVFAINDSYRMTAGGWAKVITGSNGNSEYWRNVFKEHSEFFRETLGDKTEDIQNDPGEDPQDASGEKYSLVLRRGVSSRYHKTLKKVITADEYVNLSDKEKNKLTRGPLSDTQMKMLIDLAVSLHDQAMTEKKERRLLITTGLTAVGSFGGTLLAHLFTSGPAVWPLPWR
jgi:hypothetical protein